MNKVKNPQLLVRLICVGLLAGLGIYISIAIKVAPNTESVQNITPTVTPTNTVTPTITPIPTAALIPSPTSTPTPEPERVEVPDVGDILIKDAYEYVQDYLETFSKDEPTLYNTYSEKELELLFRVVEAEATDYSIECKSHVASVIFNRLKAGWWGGDLTKCIMAKRQFAVITNGRYLKVKVTEETILACEIAFAGDTAQGALFFDSTKGKSWAHENRKYIFSDDVHWFYK